MEIDLGRTRTQPRDNPGDVIRGEMAALMEPEEPIGRADTGCVEQWVGAARERAKDRCLDQLARGVIASEREGREDRFARKAHTGNAVLAKQLDEQIGDHRMDMKIQMTVDMIQVADELQMKIDLGADLVAKHRADTAIEEIAHPSHHRIARELTAPVSDTAHLRGRGDTEAAADDEMEADVERGIVAR